MKDAAALCDDAVKSADRVKMLKDARFSAEEELKAFRAREEERFKTDVEQVRKSLYFSLARETACLAGLLNARLCEVFSAPRSRRLPGDFARREIAARSGGPEAGLRQQQRRSHFVHCLQSTRRRRVAQRRTPRSFEEL